ncbi:MAG: DinB family protein [Anaerolineales bacterium]|nr:DinB family protein [Chloroflexota bacterium]MBL6981658.1 DinB family protein [Anaerolineales bacterium]
MSDQERGAKIESYGQAFGLLKTAMDRFPKECWNYRPAADRWTIQEIIIHITDSEANSYVRCRRFISEPGRDLMDYDENKWAKDLNYGEQSTQVSLELFRWLRRSCYDLIKTLPDEVWSHEANHPENGTMTMDDWLDTYESHVRDHIAQMEENYQHWKEYGNN